MEVINVAPSVLNVHPRNQEFFDDIQGEEYERFEKSIADDGILSPLLVAPDMTVISGHQRLKASINLGLSKVPVMIKDDAESETDKTRLLLAANFGRLKNDPVKQAKVFKEYESLRGVSGRGGDRKSKGHNVALISQEDIAKELGISLKQLQRIKSLVDIDPDMQELISSGKVTPTTGYKVIAKLSPEEQAQLFESLPKDVKLSQREVQEYVDELKENLEFVNEDLTETMRRLENTKKEVEKKDQEIASTKLECETWRKKLEDKDRDVVGEMMVQKDKAEIAARLAQEKYFGIKNELDSAKGKLKMLEKKLNSAEFTQGSLNSQEKDIQEIEHLNMRIDELEKEKEALQKDIKNHPFDAEELLRVLENTRKVLQVYASAENTLAIVYELPDVKNKIEVNAKCLKDTIDTILSFATGNEFSNFSSNVGGF